MKLKMDTSVKSVNDAKLIHVVGGGKNQAPIVELLHDMGHKVLVTDMFESPYCRKLADFFAQINTVDLEGTLEVSRQYKIDAVLTDQTDVAVPTVAYIAEELGLEGVGYEVALRLTNKYLMRNYLKPILPHCTPQFHFFEEPDDAIIYCEQLKQPSNFIAKPINSQGSKGVNRLPDEGFDEVIYKAFIEGRSSGVLIEEFISGFEYSVEAYKQDNVVHNLAVTKKYHYETNDCIDYRNTYLSDVSPELESKLFNLNTSIINALGLPFGVTHAEYKINDQGKVYLIEIAGRGGGGGISSKIIPYLTGFEPNRALINRLLNADAVLPKILDYKDKYAVLRFYEFKPGRVSRILTNKNTIGHAIEFQLDLEAGNDILGVDSSMHRPGYFIVASETRDEVLRLENELLSAIQIEYE